MPRRIQVVDYDPRWPDRFKQEASRIKLALGDRALRIEHTGSTAVPGLAAKPVSDIILVVRNSADEDDYAPELDNAGYSLRIRKPEWHQHRMFKGAETNLHVFSDECPEVQRVLLFRDWLRAHHEDRELYAVGEEGSDGEGMGFG